MSCRCSTRNGVVVVCGTPWNGRLLKILHSQITRPLFIIVQIQIQLLLPAARSNHSLRIIAKLSFFLIMVLNYFGLLLGNCSQIVDQICLQTSPLIILILTCRQQGLLPEQLLQLLSLHEGLTVWALSSTHFTKTTPIRANSIVDVRNS